MADDNNQGFFRSAQPRTPMKVSTANDPLAELARLIGQTDPFAEFGLKNQQKTAAAPASHADQDWAAQGHGYAPQGHEQHGHAPADPYSTQYEQDQRTAGYESDPYFSGDASQDDMAYDDVPPPRRRWSVIAVAAVSGLAIVGTAGAVGYISLFGSTGASPPPIIKPDPAPTKVVPPSKIEAQSNKLIYDRVGERSSGEKIVSREEQPIDISKPTQANLFPNAMASGQPAMSGSNAGVSPIDQPKKIHTIVIKPDQPLGAAETPAPARTAAVKPAPTPAPAPKPAAPQRLASAPPITTADAEESAPVARAASAPARPAAPARTANAPLSLSPDAPAPARVEPTRTASAPPARAATAPVGGGGNGQYAVQISSQRSEAEAEAAFRSLQGKYPGQLGGKPHVIRRADLGSKGIYYRALVGPFASASDATELCQSLKSAGGSCLIQKN